MLHQASLHRNELHAHHAALTPNELRTAFGKFTTGVCVVTANTPDGPIGITINSFSSISLEPALVSWAIGSRSTRYPHFARCETMSIHILAENQIEICHAFARNARAFDNLDWRVNGFGTPVFEGAIARFDVTVVNDIEAGDHRIFIAQILNIEQNEGRPLVFLEGKLAKT